MAPTAAPTKAPAAPTAVPAKQVTITFYQRGYVAGGTDATAVTTDAAITVFQKNNPNVKVNIEQGTDVDTWDGNVTRSVVGLLPGQRFETFYRVKPNTAALVVTVTDFEPGSPQNLIFGNDLILANLERTEFDRVRGLRGAEVHDDCPDPSLAERHGHERTLGHAVVELRRHQIVEPAISEMVQP